MLCSTRQVGQTKQLFDAPEGSVAAERLVATVARQRANDAAVANGTADGVHGEQARIGKGLIEMAKQFEAAIGCEVCGVEIDRLVGRMAVLRYREGHPSLVILSIRKTDVERGRSG